MKGSNEPTHHTDRVAQALAYLSPYFFWASMSMLVAGVWLLMG